ncbi:hypothetical protein BS78_07G030500 [Paspalum vaginatum]|nr:hypothetical protein BS78_07G030500 [Paspalum vaginatum]
MSCFGAAPAATPAYYYASQSSGRPWRWWRARCAGIAAAVGARLRRSLSLSRPTGRGRHTHGRSRRRRHTPAVPSSSSAAHHYRRHHRGFAPVYVDDLYCAHHQHPQPALPAADAVDVVQEQPTTASGGAGKLAVAPVHARAADASRVVAVPGARVGAAATSTMRAPKPSRDAVLRRSPGRGGGVLCGAVAVKGMGEVDLRAELFIRKFKEDMRLQSQRSAEEFQAMLARGL